MLIEVESAYGDKTIHGIRLSKSALQNAMRELLQAVEEQDFLSTFCARYGYEEIPGADAVQVDYIIDLDTHLLIEPKQK